MAFFKQAQSLFEVGETSNIFNVVLLGKTGAGKSSTGNLLLGEDRFLTSAAHQSCSRTIQVEECWFDDVKLRIVDTPGFFDTSVTPEAIATELLKIGMDCKEGIHAFLFVRSFGNIRTTPEERQAFKQIEEVFGEEAMGHCIFLFTRANEIFGMTDLREKTIEGYVRQNTGDDEIYRSVGYRVVGVENHTSAHEKQLQRKTLIASLQSKVCTAGSTTYTNEVFEEAKMRYEQNIKDRIDKKVEEAVSKYLENKTHAELKEMAKGKYKNAVMAITEQHEDIPREKVELHVKSKAKILTKKAFLKKLKKIAIVLFKAAGALINLALLL